MENIHEIFLILFIFLFRVWKIIFLYAAVYGIELYIMYEQSTRNNSVLYMI